MNKINFTSFALAFFLVFVLFPQIQTARAQDGTIYIRSDGTVEGTEKIQRNGNIYTFLENITFDISGVDCIIIERDNIVVDGAGYYLIHVNDPTARISEDGLVADGQNNVTITNLAVQNFLGGICLTQCSEINITKTIVTNNYVGISLVSSHNNSIINNQITDNKRYPLSSGISLSNSENNTIDRNTVISNEDGITTIYSIRNTISNNYVAHNSIGIYIVYGGENQIFGNEITENNEWGMLLSSSNSSLNNNIIYRNNFNNNQISEGLQVSNQWYFGPESNKWDNGNEGNYWSDYTTRYPNATEINNSGSWNTPFYINEYNIDHYPTTEPIVTVIPEFPSWIILPLFLIATFTVVVYRKKVWRPFI